MAFSTALPCPFTCQMSASSCLPQGCPLHAPQTGGSAARGGVGPIWILIPKLGCNGIYLDWEARRGNSIRKQYVVTLSAALCEVASREYIYCSKTFDLPAKQPVDTKPLPQHRHHAYSHRSSDELKGMLKTQVQQKRQDAKPPSRTSSSASPAS